VVYLRERGSQVFPGSVVQFINNLLEFFREDISEIGGFVQVLADEAVSILIFDPVQLG